MIMQLHLKTAIVMPFLNTVLHFSVSGQKYASGESEEVIKKMIAAHGGLKKWQKAESFSFDNIMYNTGTQSGQNPWWVSHVMIDKADRTVYQE